jgi:hypothetical protein
MPSPQWIRRVLSAGTLVSALAAGVFAADHRVALPMLTGRVDPNAYGVDSQTITTISAWSFTGGVTTDNGFANIQDPRYDGYLGRFNLYTGEDEHYFATLDLPAGAVIDLVGINTQTGTDAVMGIALWKRFRDGSKQMLTGFSLPAHTWDTDYAGPLEITIDTHHDCEYVLDVEKTISDNKQYFGWVEIWWHRVVSPPPGTPTFNDVPVSHPFFQYVEALAASGITGGCGNGNFCPNTAVTRAQMAAFLAKALGLHWPY